MLLEEKPWKRISSGEAFENDPGMKRPFTCNDIQMNEDTEDGDCDESENESALFDSVCAICDNGGEILSCEGRCLRSFHATKDAGADTYCKSLGYSSARVEAIQNFFCTNCQYKQHQCFACGKLDSSDKVAGAKVFRCISATCGHFYHPTCIAKLVFPENEAEATVFQEKIAAGESFTCPVHRCLRCKGGENKMVKELQFAMCRRCPKAYHRKCLPRKICFEGSKEEGIVQRAWDGLLPNRILMYCLKHKIDVILGTPTRDHITYPEVPERNKAMDVQNRKIRIRLKKKQVSDENLHVNGPSVNPTRMIEKIPGAEESYFAGKGFRYNSEQVLDFNKKSRPIDDSTQSESSIMPSKKTKASAPAVYPTSTGKKFISSFPVINGEIEKQMIALMEEASTSLTLEDIISKRTMPSTHAYTARHIDKMITQGKVEGSVEAIRTALEKLQDGSSIMDAKAVCEPGIIRQIPKWRNKLKVYLAPFLIGTRYTSFGRHFTKVDKLKEIVDKLQPYIRCGDTIVDFCCGANDFSTLLKEKLDKVGKKCLFRNYDVFQPENDFNFEKRDWMTVQPEELPDGSQLIMGLNPPFGVKASLANMFIDKALSFMPKLVILIVPNETKRLDEKNLPYDLIWADCKKLAGKSFYLPGSVDTNDMQLEQWNQKPPPLYLWSRPDWTEEHMAIAMKHGQLSIGHKESHGETQSYAAPEGNKVWSEGKTPPLAILKARSPERRTSQRDEAMTGLSDMSISPPDSRDCRSKSRHSSEGIRNPLEMSVSHGGVHGSGSETGGCAQGTSPVNKGIGYSIQSSEGRFPVHSVDRSIGGFGGYPYRDARSVEANMHVPHWGEYISGTQTFAPNAFPSGVQLPRSGSYPGLDGACTNTPLDSICFPPGTLPSYPHRGSSGGLGR